MQQVEDPSLLLAQSLSLSKTSPRGNIQTNNYIFFLLEKALKLSLENVLGMHIPLQNTQEPIHQSFVT